MRWKTVVTSGLVCGVLAVAACAPAPSMVAIGETPTAPSSAPAPAATPTPTATPERSANPAASTPAPTPTVEPSSKAPVTPSMEASSTPSSDASGTPSKPTGTQSPADDAAAATVASGKRPDCSKLRCIALTFDDGPGPYTKQLLDTLAKTGSKATFFVLGPNVASRPELVKRMQREGHQIGNHSWSHPQLSHLSSQKVLSEIERTSAEVKKITGHGTNGIRPPYGDFNKSVRNTLSKVPDGEIILWSIDTLDWKTRSTAKTIASVKKEARPGAIVLMHDIHQPTVAAVPTIVKNLLAEGYTLVTVDDLLASEHPKSGQVFTHLG
ncbi:polysaccharide deacetylase family protein [uncultured Tessaracoccus sp.]|uniref:polysaccharide deacetylase family protein n=1 Tax=uncultured Tessaracoccus sp. TaxID=905023 RepID=UPI0026119341|nr:polysaccharide deacetylase family protein [uncultured Tessaracoccus sp.]